MPELTGQERERYMQITMLKSKIHRATVTQAELNYVGSITIDSKLMEASGYVANEYEDASVPVGVVEGFLAGDPQYYAVASSSDEQKYAVSSGELKFATFTIAPSLRSRMPGSTFLIMATAPKKLASNMACTPAGSASSTELR